MPDDGKIMTDAEHLDVAQRLAWLANATMNYGSPMEHPMTRSAHLAILIYLALCCGGIT